MSRTKKRPKHYWNHRIVTRIHPSAKNNLDLNKEDYRIFSVAEVHYEKSKPVSYGSDLRILTEYESLKGLKNIYKKIKSAFKKPVLDLDNWPNEWKK
jgi:hypothetical protein